jgi:hypothetical protein
MFVQFDRTTRYETRPKTRHTKALTDDGMFQDALKQASPIIAATSERVHEHQEFHAAPDYRSLLMLKQF